MRHKTLNGRKLAKLLRPITDLEKIPIVLHQLILAPNGDSAVIIEADEQRYAVQIGDSEASHMAFVIYQFHLQAHCPSVYQLYLTGMKDAGLEFDYSVLEAKEGDVTYARLVWRDPKNRQVACICGTGDALVMAQISQKPCYVLKSLISHLPTEEEWPYADEIHEE